jgi:hypothetical protein
VHIDEYDDGDYGLNATPALREAIKVIEPMILDETVTITQAAEQAHVKPHQVTRALKRRFERRLVGRGSQPTTRNARSSPIKRPNYASSA